MSVENKISRFYICIILKHISASLVSSHCALRRSLHWKLLERFLKWFFSLCLSLKNRSCLTCNTLWITSLKLLCGAPRPSTTHKTSESLRSALTAEKLPQIRQAHVGSAQRKWMACWWKADNPTCGDDMDKASEKISAVASLCVIAPENSLIMSPMSDFYITHLKLLMRFLELMFEHLTELWQVGLTAESSQWVCHSQVGRSH